MQVADITVRISTLCKFPDICTLKLAKDIDAGNNAKHLAVSRQRRSDETLQAKEIEKAAKRLVSAAYRGSTAHSARQNDKLNNNKKHFGVLNDGTLADLRCLQKDFERIMVFELPLEGHYKDMKITGHPDYFEIENGQILFLEEWKPNGSKAALPGYFKQAGLYRKLLLEMFECDDFPVEIKTYSKEQFSSSYIQQLKVNPKIGTAPVIDSYKVNVTEEELNTCLISAYNFYTGKTRPETQPSGLCPWCTWRYECPVFASEKELNMLMRALNG